MMLRSLIVILTLLAVAGPTVASGPDFVGRWRQVSSTGGDCPSCRLSISEKGELIEAKANNGWAAELALARNGDRTAAIGTGIWPSWDNRPFRLLLVAGSPGELAMHMEIRHPNGRSSKVEAIFRREPAN